MSTHAADATTTDSTPGQAPAPVPADGDKPAMERTYSLIAGEVVDLVKDGDDDDDEHTPKAKKSKLSNDNDAGDSEDDDDDDEDDEEEKEQLAKREKARQERRDEEERKAASRKDCHAKAVAGEPVLLIFRTRVDDGESIENQHTMYHAIPIKDLTEEDAANIAAWKAHVDYPVHEHEFHVWSKSKPKIEALEPDTDDEKRDRDEPIAKRVLRLKKREKKNRQIASNNTRIRAELLVSKIDDLVERCGEVATREFVSLKIADTMELLTH